jgi:hypothetical protein
VQLVTASCGANLMPRQRALTFGMSKSTAGRERDNEPEDGGPTAWVIAGAR